MKQFPLLFLFLLLSLLGYAHKTRLFIAHKNDITISIGGTYDDTTTQQNLLNSYLDFIEKKLCNRPKGIKIVILIGEFGVQISKNKLRKEYAFASFGNILKADTVFIDSKHSRFNLAVKHNYLLSVPYALSHQKNFYSEKDSGIVIKYLCFDTSMSNIIDRLLTIAEFSITNIPLIQQNQAAVRMNTHFYGESISITSYDTSEIRKLKTNRYGYGNREYSHGKYVWKIFIPIIFIILMIIIKRKYFKKKPQFSDNISAT